VYAMPDLHTRLKRIGTGREALERTTGFEPATPTLARFLGRVV
jgi:hypothetical protein